jgi:hypothetical protein
LKNGVEDRWRKDVRRSRSRFCLLAADHQLGSSINAE